MKYAIIGIKLILTLAFLAAGFAKLAGAEMMIATFEALGLGQWFRYATGLIEVAAPVLLWVRGREAIGAGLLVAVSTGAAFAHLLILGPSTLPAVVLGLLAAVVLWWHRDSLPGRTPQPV